MSRLPAALRAAQRPDRARRGGGGPLPRRHGRLSVPADRRRSGRCCTGWSASPTWPAPTSRSGGCSAPTRPSATPTNSPSSLDPGTPTPRRWRRYLRGPRGAAARTRLPSARGLSRRLARRGRAAARAHCAPSGGSRRRVEELAGVGASVADLRRRAGGAGRRRAAHLRAPERRDRPAARLDPRAAVAAAPRRLPRGRRAGARPPLGARRAGRRRRRTARRRMSRSSTTSGAAPTRPPPRTPASRPRWSVEAEEGTSFQAFLCAGLAGRGGRVPRRRRASLRAGRRRRLPGRRRPPRAVDRQPRGARPGAKAHPRRRARLPRAARGGERPGRAGRGGPRAGARVRGDPAVLRAPADAAGLALAGGRRARPRRAGAPGRRRCASASARSRLHRPRGLQHALFFDHLPQPGGGAVPDYLQQMTVEQFGAMVADRERRGRLPRRHLHRLHPAGGGRPVRLRPDRGAAHRAALRRPARRHARLGQDARRADDRLRRPAARLAGRRLRPQARPRPRPASPELEGEVEVLELSGRRRAPGQARPAGDRAARAARGAGLQLPARAAARSAAGLGERDRPRGARRGAGRRAEPAAASSPGCARATPTPAREAAEALDVLSDFGLARLGFADGEASAESRPTSASVITIRTPGLSLPDPGASRETYTRAERVSVATLSLVAALALRLVSDDRSRHKIVLLDEAWFLLGLHAGPRCC